MHFSLYRRLRKRWRSRELRRARLRLLRTRQACLNLWYDRCFACLRESLCVAYEYRWVTRCLRGNYPHVPKLRWSLMRDGLIMWWHEGQQGGTVVAYQPCVIQLSPTLTWTESCYRSFPACSKVAMISDERWPNHVVTWRAARWYCCSIPALRHPTSFDVNVVGATLPFFPLSVLPHVSLPGCGLVSW